MVPINALAEYLIKSGLGTSSTVIGCTRSEIMSIEIRCNTLLPDVYKDYLQQCGKSCGILFAQMNNVCYPEVLLLTDHYRKWFGHGKDTTERLPDGAFVFADDVDASMFFFFKGEAAAQESEVFRYDCDAGRYHPSGTTFSDFLEEAVREALSCREKYYGRDFWKMIVSHAEARANREALRSTSAIRLN